MCTCLSQDPRSTLLDELRSELKAANEEATAQIKAVQEQLQQAEHHSAEAAAAAEANARRASEAEAAAEALRMEATEDANARLHAEEVERLGVAAATELTDMIRFGRTMCTFVYAKSMYNSSVQFMNV